MELVAVHAVPNRCNHSRCNRCIQARPLAFAACRSRPPKRRQHAWAGRESARDKTAGAARKHRCTGAARGSSVQTEGKQVTGGHPRNKATMLASRRCGAKTRSGASCATRGKLSILGCERCGRREQAAAPTAKRFRTQFSTSPRPAFVHHIRPNSFSWFISRRLTKAHARTAAVFIDEVDASLPEHSLYSL